MPRARRRVPAPIRRARSSGLALVAGLAISLALPMPPGAGVSIEPALADPATVASRTTPGVDSGRPTPSPSPAVPAPPPDPPDGAVAGIVSHAIGDRNGRRPSLGPDDDRALANPRHGPDPASLTGYQWPIPRGRITRSFGPAWGASFVVHGEPFHNGLDLATFCGDRVLAAHGGVVLAAGRHYDEWLGWRGDLAAFTARLDEGRLWGLLPIVVVIDDGNGYRSIYGHFSKVAVKPGQRVRAGQLIGYEGRTGRASGCHLHYELFSPWETDSLRLDPAIAKQRRLPATQIARIDPELVFPPRPTRATRSPTPSPTPGGTAAPAPASPTPPIAVSGSG